MKNVILLLCAFGFGAHAHLSDPGWPRSYSNGSADLVVYQPQVDSWSDFKLLKGRCAFALRPVSGREPVYGTFRFEGETLVDADRKIVLLRAIRAFDMRFPSAPGGVSVQWTEMTKSLLPSDALVDSLDRVLAFVHAAEVPKKEARVLTDPPPIFASGQPAVLVILDGDPVTVEVGDGGLRRVVNTNWELYLERGVYYLRHGNRWLASPDLRSRFAPATELPPDIARLPVTEESAGATPRVIVVDKPSELIVTQGPPVLAPVAGTQLSAVTNTESDLFFHSGTRSHYFLAAGRWFQATGLDGPWRYASLTLPSDFKRVPADHPRAHVLAAVPDTREAEDAVLLAAIPRTAEVNRSEAKADVQYAGAPQFVPISGTSISYAKNTPNDVLRVGDLYYLCKCGWLRRGA